MPVKRRIDKRRDALTDNERNWLIGKPSGFVEFVPHEKLVALWQTYGDASPAEWDERENTNPVARES